MCVMPVASIFAVLGAANVLKALYVPLKMSIFGLPFVDFQVNIVAHSDGYRIYPIRRCPSFIEYGFENCLHNVTRYKIEIVFAAFEKAFCNHSRCDSKTVTKQVITYVGDSEVSLSVFDYESLFEIWYFTGQVVRHKVGLSICGILDNCMRRRTEVKWLF